MAIPTITELQTLDYVVNGKIFNRVPAKTGIYSDLSGLEYVLLGKIHNDNLSLTVSQIYSFIGVLRENISTANGVALDDISSINDVPN